MSRCFSAIFDIAGLKPWLSTIAHTRNAPSMMGPLLFLLYVNDLHKCSSELYFHLFAEDTNIFLQDQNLECLELKLNEELDKLNQWLQLNRLSLNIDKTNFVIFHPPQRKIPSFNLKISGTPVEQKTCVKYLGLIIDCHLNWKKTCS